MRQFVLCYAFRVPSPPINEGILLQEGDDGRLNLPGGDVVGGEMPEIAAQRYLRAVGVEPSLPDITIVGALQYVDEQILLCRCPIKGRLDINEATARVRLLTEITHEPGIPPVMKVVIPMLKAGVKGFLVGSAGPFIGVNLEGWA